MAAINYIERVEYHVEEMMPVIPFVKIVSVLSVSNAGVKPI